MPETDDTQLVTPAEVPQSSTEIDLRSYEVYQTPELDQAIAQVVERLAPADQTTGRQRILATLRYVAATALIEEIISESSQFEIAPHLIIDNLELFTAKQANRLTAMKTAVLVFLTNEYLTDYVGDVNQLSTLQSQFPAKAA